MKAFNWGRAYKFRGWVHDQHGQEQGSKQVGCDTAAVAERLCLIHKLEAERVTGPVWSLETSKSIPGNTSSNKTTLPSLPKQSSNEGPSFQIYEPI